MWHKLRNSENNDVIFCDRLSRSDLDKNDLDKNRLSGFKVPESRHDFIRIDVEGDVSHLTTGISLAFQLLSLSLRNYNKEHNIRKHPQYGDQQRHSHERNDIIGVDYSVGKFDCNGNCDCLCLCGCQSMPGVVTVQEIDLSTAVDEIKGDDLSQIAEAQTTESEGDSSVTIGRKNRRKWRVVARMANDVKESGDESKRDVEQEELKSKTEHTVSLMVREMIGIADCNDFVDEKTPDDENRDVNARHDSHERPVAKFAPPDHFDYGLNWMECLLLFVTCLERNKLEHLSLIVDNHCRFFSQWECVFAGRVDHFHCSDFSSMQLIRLLTELLGGVGFITLLNNSNITVKEWGWSGMQHCASGSELSVFSSDHCVEWIRVKRYDIILRVCEYRHHVQRIWCVFNNTITMRSIIALVDPPINFCATSRDSTNHLRFSQLRVCDSKCSTVSCSHASRYKKLYYTLRAMECELLTSRLADRDITANTLVVIDQRPYICFHTVCGGGAYISLFRRLHYDLRVRRNEATRHNLSDSCNDDIEEAATDDDADVLIVCRGTAARLGERSGLSSVFDDFSWDIGSRGIDYVIYSIYSSIGSLALSISMSASPSSLSTSSSSFSSSTRTSASHVPLRVAIYGKSLGGAHAQIIASYFSHTPTVRVVESASMSRKRRRDRRLRLFRHSNKNGAIDRGADEVIDEVAVSYCLRVVRIHTYGSVGICPLIAKRFHKSMKVHRCTICHVKRLVDEKEHKQKDEAHETETPSTPINTKNCEIIHFRNGGELNKNEMDHIPMVGGVLIGHNVTTMIESNQRNDALVSDSNITKDTSPLASLAGGKDEEQNNQSSLCGKGQGYSVCLVLLMWLGEVLQVRVNETENSSSTSSKAHDQTKHYHDAVKFRDSNEEFVADPREHARKGDNDTYMLPSDKNNEFDAHQCLFYYASDRRHHFDMIVGACYLRSFRAHSRQSTLFFHHHHLKCHRRSRNINNEDRRVNQTDTVSDELENSQSLSGTDRVEVAQENRYLSVYFKDLSEFERMLRIGILIFDSNDIFYGEGEELIRKNDENDTTATAEGVIKKESTISNQIDRENEISWILESELCRGKQLEFARKLLSSIFCVVPKPRSHALYAVDTSVRNGDCFRSSTDDEESIIAEKEKHDDSWKKLKKKKKTKCICRSPDSWQQRESNHHSNDHQNGDGDETEHAHQEKLFLRRKCICYEKLWKNYYLKSNVFDHMSSRERRQYQRLQKSHNEEHIADHSNRKSHGRTSLGFKNRIHHQLDNLMSYDILDITPRVHFSVVPLNHKKGVKSGTVAREVQCRGRVNSEKNTDVDDRDLRKVISRSLKSSQLIMLPTASAILTTNSALSRTSSMGDGAANNEG